MKLINVVTVFFIACPLGFYVLAQLHVPLGLIYFVWIGVFNLMIVAQFWSFANDVYTKDQGERLFAIVAFGGSLGAVIGSVLTSRLIPVVGVAELLLVAAGLLILAVMISNVVDARERARHETHLPMHMTTAEVRNRCTITGGVEIGRLPGVVQLNMLVPMDKLDAIGIGTYVRQQYGL